MLQLVPPAHPSGVALAWSRMLRPGCGYLKEKLHVCTAEVVGVEELPEDAHRQRDAVQNLLNLTLQALQHLVRAQVGSSLDRRKDRHPKAPLMSSQVASWHSGYWKRTSPYPQGSFCVKMTAKRDFCPQQIRDHQAWKTHGVLLILWLGYKRDFNMLWWPGFQPFSWCWRLDSKAPWEKRLRATPGLASAWSLRMPRPKKNRGWGKTRLGKVVTISMI